MDRVSCRQRVSQTTTFKKFRDRDIAIYVFLSKVTAKTYTVFICVVYFFSPLHRGIFASKMNMEPICV